MQYLLAILGSALAVPELFDREIATALLGYLGVPPTVCVPDLPCTYDVAYLFVTQCVVIAVVALLFALILGIVMRVGRPRLPRSDASQKVS